MNFSCLKAAKCQFSSPVLLVLKCRPRGKRNGSSGHENGNRPFPSSFLPLFENKSSFRIVHMKMSLIYMKMNQHGLEGQTHFLPNVTSSSGEELNQFITAANSFHPVLKYTWEISRRYFFSISVYQRPSKFLSKATVYAQVCTTNQQILS